ncbi:MAG: hemolysin III family protein [Rhodobacteraceae bacterium]|nr:MAG: hemolysin III family protein [Paracoccaceae bacterium]
MARTVYSRGEIVADAVVHAVGVSFAAVAGPFLVARAAAAGDAATLAAVSVYAATMFATFALSACYNLLPAPRWREALRRLDHGAIYLKIAGTYTPFAAVSLAKSVGGALLVGVWTVAGIGFLVKIAAPRRFEAGSIALYLALGWAIVWVAREALEALSPAALTLLAAGGVLYTVGVAFHLWDALRFQNAIWHLHVLVASVCMYAAVVVELF